MHRAVMTSDRRLIALSTVCIAFAWASILSVVADTLAYREEIRRGAA